MDILGELELPAQPRGGLKVNLGYLSRRKGERVSESLKVLLKNRMAHPLLELRLCGLKGLGQGFPISGHKTKRIPRSSDASEGMLGCGNRSSGSTRVNPDMLQLLNRSVPMPHHLLEEEKGLPYHQEARVRSLRDFPGVEEQLIFAAR